MRKRAALVGAGIAVMAMAGINAPAQAAAPGTSVSAEAAAPWLYIATYNTKSKCIDAGQQYVREGFSAYKCEVVSGTSSYYLYVR